MRDLSRFVKLTERKLLDAHTMIQVTYPLERTADACREITDRTMVANAVVLN